MAKPVVSIIMPLKNEENYLPKCLDALYAQDYPLKNFEIVVADGNSADKTIKILNNYNKTYHNIRILKNPTGNTAKGRNICYNSSDGKYIMNYSGHAIAEKNLLSTLVKKIEKPNKKLGAVGCSNLDPDDDSFVAQSMGVVFSTFLGGFGATAQNLALKKDAYVPSMAFTLYKREVFEKISGFDPELWVGQDGEFNLRMHKAGYKLLYTPGTHVYLHKRSTIRKAINHMYRYGIGGFKRIQKHPDSFNLFFLIPPVFAAYIILFTFLSIFNKYILLLFTSTLILYSIIMMLSAFTATKRVSIILASPVFYFIEHFFYGVGFIKGILGHDFNKK